MIRDLSRRRWLIAFGATVLACGIIVPVTVSQWIRTARSVVTTSSAAQATLSARVTGFADDLARISSTSLPDDATIRQIAAVHKLNVWNVDRSGNLTMVVAGAVSYGLGLDGQSVYSCFRTTVVAEGHIAHTVVAPLNVCPHPTPTTTTA
jgi:hypothetical protein